MKRKIQSFIFFIGWVLSPLTTWNDSFINIPLAYLMANFIYLFIKVPFKWLFIVSYVFTDILGFVLMFISGKNYIFTKENKIKAAVSLAANTAVFSIIIILLDKSGVLAPLSVYISKLCHLK